MSTSHTPLKLPALGIVDRDRRFTHSLLPHLNINLPQLSSCPLERDSFVPLYPKNFLPTDDSLTDPSLGTHKADVHTPADINKNGKREIVRDPQFANKKQKICQTYSQPSTVVVPKISESVQEKELHRERLKCKVLEEQFREERYQHSKLLAQHELLKRNFSKIEHTNELLNGDNISDVSLDILESLIFKLKTSEQKVIDEIIRRTELTKIREEEAALCIICMESKKEKACLPCGHFIMCSLCCEKLKEKKMSSL
eukprot:TRINITY_DN5810_c0_g1_i1.p1 TRINITY_DN5810_c0_g1~~TRINITY_DN5810_c0_g1_i1.p1  ORF type:complete len:255 (-),score=20.48 TRINITY_DN5810_c0_g1_i1:85-849(-)